MMSIYKKQQQRSVEADARMDGGFSDGGFNAAFATSSWSAQFPQLLLATVEGLQTGVMIFNELQVVYANPEFKRLLDYGPGETLQGVLITDLVAESDRLLALQRRNLVAAGRRIPTGWIKLKAKSGKPVQMMPSLSRMLWNDQLYFIVVASRAVDQSVLQVQAHKTRVRYERLLTDELEKQQAAIARELHDSLGSELAGISLMLGSLKVFRGEDAALLARLDNVQAQLQAAVEITRALARSMMPVDAHPGSFWHAMEKLASDWTVLRGVPCEFSMRGEFDHVSAETGTHLYRIAQEAIANALRHGKATLIKLRLTDNTPDQMLEIEDNGIGFDVSSDRALHGDGLGIRSMMARADAIGGHIELSPARPVGSCVRVIWPAGPSV